MKLDDVRKYASPDFQYTEEKQHQLHKYLSSISSEPSGMYQELEMSSRHVETYRDISYSDMKVALHSHNFYELLYFSAAEGVEYLVDSHRYRLCNGDVICIPPGISHRPILPQDRKEPYERYVVWLNPDFVTKMELQFLQPVAGRRELPFLIRTQGTRWENLADIFLRGIREAERKRTGWETAVIGNTLMILTYLSRAHMEHNAGIMKEEQPDLLDRVTAFIEAHYAEHFTVKDISRKFYVSDSTVSHLFKQKMGISIYHYVTQRRLILAKTLIMDGIPLEQVAARVGFSDYSTFYRAFRQEYGISPRQYKNL